MNFRLKRGTFGRFACLISMNTNSFKKADFCEENAVFKVFLRAIESISRMLSDVMGGFLLFINTWYFPSQVREFPYSTENGDE